MPSCSPTPTRLPVSVLECLFDLGRWGEALELADQLLERHRDLAESYEGASLPGGPGRDPG
jgi:hypothetical protein